MRTHDSKASMYVSRAQCAVKIEETEEYHMKKKEEERRHCHTLAPTPIHKYTNNTADDSLVRSFQLLMISFTNVINYVNIDHRSSAIFFCGCDIGVSV